MSGIGFDPVLMGVLAAAYAGLVPVLEVATGVLADRWSRRGVLVIAYAGLAASSLVGGLSHGVTGYFVSACCSASTLPAAPAPPTR